MSSTGVDSRGIVRLGSVESILKNATLGAARRGQWFHRAVSPIEARRRRRADNRNAVNPAPMSGAAAGSGTAVTMSWPGVLYDTSYPGVTWSKLPLSDPP